MIILIIMFDLFLIFTFFVDTKVIIDFFEYCVPCGH